MSAEPCPCGGGAFDDCCGPYLAGARPAPDPEALMRSRYTAYVLRNVDYLLATWHPLTRPVALRLDSGARWLGLGVLRVEAGAADGCAVVEFVARFKVAGRAQRLHERSRFVRAGRRWYYHGALP